MTVKERLHQLVDQLPESEEQTAARILEALAATATPLPAFPAVLRDAPPDDEPQMEEERAAAAEAWEDVHAGRVATLDEVKRELGL